MKRNNKNFKHGLIGINKCEVNNFINFIRKEQEEKIDRKLDKIKELEMNNADIKQKIKRLKNDIELKMQPKENMEFAIERAEEWGEVLFQNTNIKVAKIEKFGKEQEILINKKIEIYNDVFKNSKEKLKVFLNMELQENIDLIEEMNKFLNDESRNIDRTKDNIISSYDDIAGKRNNLEDDSSVKDNISESYGELNINVKGGRQGDLDKKMYNIIGEEELKNLNYEGLHMSVEEKNAFVGQ